MNDREIIQEMANKTIKLEGGLEFVCEMANKFKEETLLPMNIWIDETGAYIRGKHGKRIKFQLDKAEDFENENTASMDFDGNIYPKNLVIRKLKNCDIEALRNFVQNNRYALEQIADQKVRLFKIWNDIIKGGEIASNDDIKALKDKVDILMAEKKSHQKM